ncbi:hypothetical protein [Thiobacillus sp.]|uniref:hypothetical protein n=1 Tax=Thiobacillus sp. TaxID=924 RepID=UPI002600F72D|nr:hypothetical protein [Thiobacillus sp.]MBT9539401.1 hypothetical protein [Thiobacillus sp.]
MADTFEVTTSPGLKLSGVLRRYMDLAKYIDLLRTESLYFRRADKFSDRFEGALTPVIRRSIDEAHRDGHTNENSETFYRRARVGSLVSCWSIGARDNMALWKLYGGAATSIAVTTMIERLLTVASTWPDLTYISKVRYINHFANPDMVIGHYTDPLEFKHEAYSYERELRILISRHRGDWERTPESIHLPIADLNSFVRSVVVGPEAPDWFYNLIVDITKRYGVNSPVRRSTLTNVPI